MKLYKGIFIAGMFGLFAAAGAVFIAPHAALAADCTLNVSDFAKIKAIQQDPTLNYGQELAAELAARKELVGATLDCAVAEAQTAQASLKNASHVDDDSERLRSALLGKLDDAFNFYDIEKGKLGDAGIAGTQSLAREVLDWRKGTYAPLAGEVNNFTIWSNNQDLFATAKTRMDQTSRAVAFLESASGNADLENAFVAAQQSFSAAQGENDAARSALAQFLPPDQSLALIKQSLDSLSDTYQKFFALSTIVSGLLSH